MKPLGKNELLPEDKLLDPAREKLLKESCDLSKNKEVNLSCPRIPMMDKFNGTNYLCKGCQWYLPNAPEFLNCALICWDFAPRDPDTQEILGFSIQEIAEMTGETYATIEGITKISKQDGYKEVATADPNDDPYPDIRKKYKVK